jgi:hypothetical protein
MAQMEEAILRSATAGPALHAYPINTRILLMRGHERYPTENVHSMAEPLNHPFMLASCNSLPLRKGKKTLIASVEIFEGNGLNTK